MRPSWLSRSEAAFLLLCFLILAWQLLLPGFIGLANNGDFGKVIGPFCIGPADRGADNFVYFQPSYIRGSDACWSPQIPTVAIAFGWFADFIAGHPQLLDIRWVGILHVLCFLSFYWQLLLGLRDLNVAWRIALSVAAIVVFADTANATYLNSFYPDVPGILGALIGVFSLRSRNTLTSLLWFGTGCFLFVSSKGQHGMFAPLLAAAALALTWRTARPLGACLTFVLLAGGVYSLATPPWYPAQARFNLIFYRIAKLSATPESDLRELGFDSSYMRYVGMHSFVLNAPTENEPWMRDFAARSSWRALLIFYMRHPDRALRYLRHDLETEAFQRRALNLANFSRASGKPEGATSYRFALWSTARIWLFIQWPWHIAVVLVLLVGASIWLREWSVLALCFMAVVEFGVASLADTLETHRHLLMFHVLTDIAVFQCVVAWVRQQRTLKAASKGSICE